MVHQSKPTSRTMSSVDVKNDWDAIVEAASEGEAVIVESHGTPKAVVISPEAFEELREARERARREEVIAWLDDFEKRQMERNKDLTQEEADALANRAAHEIFDELAAEGKLRFARDEQQS